MLEQILGRHVAGLALAQAGLGGDLIGIGAGDAEVDEPHAAFDIDHQVVGGDVAVNEVQRLALERAQGMGIVKPGAGVGDERGGERRQQGTFVQIEAGAQVEPVDELQGHEQLAVELAAVEHAHHVGVVEARGEAGLIEEHVAQPRVFGEVGVHALEHDVGVAVPRSERLGEPDLGHATQAELTGEPVLPEGVLRPEPIHLR